MLNVTQHSCEAVLLEGKQAATPVEAACQVIAGPQGAARPLGEASTPRRQAAWQALTVQ